MRLPNRRVRAVPSKRSQNRHEWGNATLIEARRRPQIRWSIIAAVSFFTLYAMMIGLLAGRHNPTGLFGGIGIIALFWLGRYWRTAVPVLLVVSCTDGFAKHLNNSSAFYILKDALVLAILIGMIVDLATNRDARPVGRWQGIFPWLFYLTFMIADAAIPHISFASQLAGFRARVFFSLMVVIGVMYFTSPRVLVRAGYVLIVAITIGAMAGIIQVILGTTWEGLGVGFLIASQKYQAFSSLIGAYFLAYGTMVDPESLGLACGFGLLVAMAMLGFVRGVSKLWLLVAMLVMVTGLLLSGARGAILGTVVGMIPVLVLSFGRKETRGSAWLAVAIVSLGLPLSTLSSGGSSSERFTAESTSFAADTRAASYPLVSSALQTHPLGLGLGAAGAGGNAVANSDSVPIDNYFLAIVYETGPLGLVLLVTVLLTIFTRTLKCAFDAQTLGARTVYIGYAGAQVELFVSAFFTQGSWDYAPVAQAFWLLAGATVIPLRVEGLAEKLNTLTSFRKVAV